MKDMQTRTIIVGLIVSALTMIIIGIFALKSNMGLLDLLSKSEKEFHVGISAAAELSSYSKRAEGHLFLYLMLHREKDKEKFPKRIASLHEQISIIEKSLVTPEAIQIFKKIQSYAGNNLSLGNSLITDHDKEFRVTGKFEIERHQQTVKKLHDNFSEIRRNGVDLAKLLVSKASENREELIKQTTLLQSILTILIILTALFSGYMGYMLRKIIPVLKKENTARIKSQDEIRQERDKLKKALAEIKVLSGLLPICSICKKVKSDEGYWDQIENYISSHTELTFTHGLCHDCAEEHYPQFFPKDK